MSDQAQGPGWWQGGDGKWYPPAPQKQGMNGCLKAVLIGAAIALVLGVGCVALLGEAADEADREQAERREAIRTEATIETCETDELGWMAATVRIENTSADRSNYSVEVAFESPDGSEQYASGVAFVSGLRSGQTATERAVSLQEPPGEFTCDILDVTRFSDEP